MNKPQNLFECQRQRPRLGLLIFATPFVILLTILVDVTNVYGDDLAATGKGLFVRVPKPIPGEYIVVLDREIRPVEVKPTASALTKRFGGRLLGVLTNTANLFHVEMNEHQALALANAPGVVLVEENGYWDISAPTGEWHLDRIDQGAGRDDNYNTCWTGDGVSVYVVDTGVAHGHDEFAVGNGSKVVDGVNYSSDSYSSINPCGGYSFSETNISWTYLGGHGTSVASLIAGNTVGVSPNAQIISVKVANCSAAIQTNHLAWGLDWIRSTSNPYRALRPALVNMSLYTELNDPLVGAVEHVINGLVLTDYDMDSGRPAWSGIPVIVSANNQDGDACALSPARMAWSNTSYPTPGRVISVGGTRADDTRWDCIHRESPTLCSEPGSNFGTCVDIYAPAHNLNSASLKSPSSYRELYSMRSGTSFSAAIVSGITAQYLEQSPSLTPAQLWSAMNGRSVVLSNTGDYAPHNVGPIPFVKLPACP